MKKLLAIVILASVILSCSKTEDLTIPEIRLASTTSYTKQDVLVTTEFKYDTAGRISGLTNSLDPQQALVSAEITYEGNQLTIRSVSTVFDYSVTIHYLLDDSGKPTSRYSYTHNSNGDANTSEENSRDIADSTFYEYDSNGLLSRTRKNQSFSTMFRMGNNTSYNEKMEVSVTDYINTDRRLSHITTESSYTNWSNGNSSSGSAKRTWQFEYLKNYPNTMDFKNALLLSELGVLSCYPYPLNKNYLNFPDKVTEEIIQKDQNGQITYSNVEISSIDMTFNEDGYLNMITTDQPNVKPVNLFYSK